MKRGPNYQRNKIALDRVFGQKEGEQVKLCDLADELNMNRSTLYNLVSRYRKKLGDKQGGDLVTRQQAYINELERERENNLRALHEMVEETVRLKDELNKLKTDLSLMEELNSKSLINKLLKLIK